jgi:hypothetical protein
MTSGFETGAHAAGDAYPGAGSSYAPGHGEGAHTTGQQGSLGDLFSSVTSDLSTLVRQEIALAKAEATQSATRAGKGAGFLAGAGVGAHFVLLFLSVALWEALGSLIGLGWSALIVAAIWAIVAAVLATRGRAELKAVRGMPTTTGTVKQIPDALKGHEENNR